MTTSLSIDAATLDDIATYKIHAKNPAGEDSCVVKLNVTVKKEKPKFLKKPADKEVKETEDVVFETEVEAKPEPTVEWYEFVQMPLNPYNGNFYDLPNSTKPLTSITMQLSSKVPNPCQASNNLMQVNIF